MSRFDRRCDTEVPEVRRLEVINGELGRRKWSAERKGEIDVESMQPGVVSELARQHNLTPQQLFAWRHEAKQGRLVLPEEAMPFVPVVAVADKDSSSTASSAPTKGKIEIHLSTTLIKVPDEVSPNVSALPSFSSFENSMRALLLRS